MSDRPVKRSPGSSRRYVTPKRDQRAAATRAAILAAAETLFLRDGYARTSMKAIAAEAGVSEKTMYLAFTTKATLLRQVIQFAVQGDETSTPLSERERMARAGPRTGRRGLRALRRPERRADDPDGGDHRARRGRGLRRSRAGGVPRPRARRHLANLRALAAELNRRGALAPGVSEQQAVDTIYALATDEGVFLRLTRECGWTPARYAELIGRTLTATLGTT